MNEIYFSIIIPSFNRASFLSKAINSVINQSFQNWELIIVDDGSTDNTRDLVDGYILNDKRIKYIYQENAERSAARNNGINRAKGNYICFLDSDDQYHYSHLQNFVDLINKQYIKRALYFSGVSINKYNPTKTIYYEDIKSDQEFVLLNSLGTPRACVAKELLVENKFDENIRIGEDKELWMRITKTAPVFYHKKNSFIEIDHNDRSIFGNATYENLSTLKYIFLINNVEKRIQKKLLSNTYLNISKFEIKRNNRIVATKYILKSIITQITNKQSKLKFNVLVRLMFGQNLFKIYKIIS